MGVVLASGIQLDHHTQHHQQNQSTEHHEIDPSDSVGIDLVVLNESKEDVGKIVVEDGAIVETGVVHEVVSSSGDTVSTSGTGGNDDQKLLEHHGQNSWKKL